MISPLGYVTLYFQSNTKTYELKDVKKKNIINEYECKIEKNIINNIIINYFIV